jgi:hypothetical protein
MRKCKTTSYDTDDLFEAELLEFAEKQGKYSKYVKRLIAEDKTKKEKEQIPVQDPEPIIEESEPKGDIDSFL